MPELEDYFHYRCIDVSSVKELTKRWRPDINIKHAQKNAAHRAEADVYESINELRFYRDTIFAQSS
jgi:oligoribonuclease